jgi:hypothetical protein
VLASDIVEAILDDRADQPLMLERDRSGRCQQAGKAAPASLNQGGPWDACPVGWRATIVESYQDAHGRC